MKKHLLAGLAGSLLLGATSFAMLDNGGVDPDLTITDVVAASGGTFDSNSQDFDILLTAVLTAGLEGALADPDAGVTVFAPKDRAFIGLARDLGYNGIDEEGAWNFLVAALTTLGKGDPIPVLTDILLYHVADEEIGLLQFLLATFFQQSFTSLQGGELVPRFFRIQDAEPDLQDPRLSVPFNIQVSNGVIHSINRVLIPVDLP